MHNKYTLCRNRIEDADIQKKDTVLEWCSGSGSISGGHGQVTLMWAGASWERGTNCVPYSLNYMFVVTSKEENWEGWKLSVQIVNVAEAFKTRRHKLWFGGDLRTNVLPRGCLESEMHWLIETGTLTTFKEQHNLNCLGLDGCRPSASNWN